MEAIKLKEAPYVRLAHNDLTEGEKKTFKGEEKVKFSTAFMLPKNKEALASIPGLTDTQAKTILDLAKKYKEKVMKAGTSEKPKGAKLDNLFKDGDEMADAKIEAFKEENPKKEVPKYLDNTRNFWVCNAGSYFEQKFFGPKGGENLGKDWASENIYDGCWCRIETRGYSWNFTENKMTKKGWSLGLAGSIQKWQDAEKFASGSNGEDEEVEETMELVTPEASDDDFID